MRSRHVEVRESVTVKELRLVLEERERVLTTDLHRSNVVKEMEKHCKRSRQRRLLQQLQLRVLVEQEVKEPIRSDDLAWFVFWLHCRLYVFVFSLSECLRLGYLDVSSDSCLNLITLSLC